MHPGFPLELPTSGALHLRIADALVAAIRAGRLRAGDPIPGSRALAESLGVHRNTVLRSLTELRAQGWLEATPAKGTFVSTELPQARGRAAATPSEPPRAAAFALRGFTPTAAGQAILAANGDRAPSTRKRIELFGGVPDLVRAPRAELARAYRRSIARARVDALDYGDPRGEPVLREALARMLAESRGLPFDPSRILVTRGSQMALFLAARTVLAPGDVVAVEAWGYRPAWEAFRAVGAEVRPIPVDDQGLDVAALAALAKTTRLRAVYLTPHHQYPTTVVLAASRRLALLDLARRERFAIFEDDYDHEFHYEGRPVLPLAHADRHGSVVHLGTLSKILAPGLRLGFLVATDDLVARAAELRTFLDRQGDRAVERAIAELLDDGTVQRHARRMRRTYLERRDAMVDAVRAAFGDDARFAIPNGGLALWAEFPGTDVARWTRDADEAGVAVHPGSRFAFDGAPNAFLRLGFGANPPEVLRTAVARLARARPRVRR